MNNETKIIGGIGLITVVILVIGVLFLSKTSSPTPNSIPVVSDSEKQYLIRDTSFQTNPQNAKISVVEFADFQCPACGAVYPAIKAMKEQYADRVNFVFRHMPLQDLHKNAINAAIASEAAGVQGKFWEMYDQLFAAQSVWSDRDDPEDDFMKLAENAGVDLDKFKLDYESKINQDKINSDYKDGVSLGVNSTPTFFINNKKYVGVLSQDQFKQAIEAELAAVGS